MKRLFANAEIVAWENNDFKVIKNGYLGIDGDTIDYIGTEKPEAAYDVIDDMTGRILMPGLVNSHCHAAMTLLRGIGSDLPLQEWLFDNMFPIEDRLTTEDMIAGAELAQLELLASGVTSVTDMYMEPKTLITLNEAVGMKINLTRVVQSFDPTEDPEKNPKIPESIDLYKEFNGVQNGRIRVDFGIHAEYTSTDRCIRHYADRMRPFIEKGDCQLQIHVSETAAEHGECVARHGLTPVAWLEKMGLLDLPCTMAHCVWVTEPDMKIMAAHGATAVHNPTSNMKLGSGFAPIQRMLDLGINVALGTDGTASNNNLNMFEEMHIASIIHNGYHRDPTIMKPSTVLKMATVNGARQQGRKDTGTLEVGKKADICAVDLRGKPHLYPSFDALTTLTYSAQGSDVCMTMVDGKILYKDGEFLTIDKDRVFHDVSKSLRRLYGEV